jgi:asparagine synthase (glutamine-hydrolysing)
VCGISGVYARSGPVPEDLRIALAACARQLAHRGPDDFGEVRLPYFCAAHNRLSIIDLATGHQPMVDEANGNVIVFNGEIYNYVELRDALEQQGHSFRTSSDTEVLLKCYAQFGTEMFTHLNGMFAFGLYDAVKNELILARDRFGEKPLFWIDGGASVQFASELGALARFQRRVASPTQRGLLDYFAFGYVAGPETILPDILQVLPGHYVRVSPRGASSNMYYDLPPAHPAARPTDEEIGHSLREAIKLRLRADVPVATFLSGGIDSSLITVLAQRESPRRLDSYSFGWLGADDERPYARLAAKLAGTNHHEVELDRGVFGRDVTAVVGAMDMPYAGSALFVVYALSREVASHGVKVVLSGDGGDELFGGYPWYQGAEGPRRRARRLLLGRTRNARDYLLGKSVFSVEELARVFGDRAVTDLFAERTEAYARWGDDVAGRSAIDLRFFMPWLLMPKVDRMSMAHSLEVRAPLLDHNLVETWIAVAGRQKVSGRDSKVRLKRYLLNQKVLPGDLLWRKKLGMNLPISWWIRQNAGMFREVVLDRGSLSTDLFGRPEVEGWIREVVDGEGAGWSGTAQRVWAAFIIDVWSAQRSAPLEA